MSWADRRVAAKPGIERAQVMLAQARTKNSKARAHYLIEDAIEESQALTDVDSLLGLYELEYSLVGLRRCAELFAKDLANPATRKAYFKIA